MMDWYRAHRGAFGFGNCGTFSDFFFSFNNKYWLLQEGPARAAHSLYCYNVFDPWVAQVISSLLTLVSYNPASSPSSHKDGSSPLLV